MTAWAPPHNRLLATLVLGPLVLVACLPAAPAAKPAVSLSPAPKASPSPIATPAEVPPAPTALPSPAATPDTGSTPTTARVTTTTVIVFRPELTPSLEQEGDCWARSVAVWRPEAWRCRTGNQIYDPCFSTGDKATFVGCFSSPFSDARSIVISLTKPLPAEERVPQGQHAWALELADGIRCTFLQGATAGIEGKRINYSCTDGWYIVGDPETRTVWTAQKVLVSRTTSPPSAENSVRVDIRTVWQ